MFLAAAADDTFFESDTWGVARNLAIFFALVFWAATVYWVYKDARRRIEDPWLIAMATLLGAVPPFIGPLIYMLFRPPEYLENVRERELEILAIEEQLAERDLRCPVCRGQRGGSEDLERIGLGGAVPALDPRPGDRSRQARPFLHQLGRDA